MNQEAIVVFGSNGQLGLALRQSLPKATFYSEKEFDITDPARYEKEDWSRHKTIINAAAFTAVDVAETPEGRLLAWQVNATAVGLMARVATERKITLVHISSDYVFDGTREVHDESEPLSPLGVYGQSKAAGDIAAVTAPKHYLIRTSWVIGDGQNFVRTMMGLVEKGVEPKVVDDRFGRLTFTTDLAETIGILLEKEAPFGVYNFSNGGEVVSWAQVAKEIFRAMGKSERAVTAVSTVEYSKDKPSSAPRPPHSTFDLAKITNVGVKPSDWLVALDEYLKEKV